VRFGLFLGLADDHDGTLGLAVSAAEPGHPVRAAGLTLDGAGGARGVGHGWPDNLSSLALRQPQPSHRIEFLEVLYVTLTCPNCGNDRNFLVKTLQMHVVHLEDGNRVEVSEESRPAILEVLCDECESALNFEEFEDTLRKEVLLTIGAR
jgi:hypothetical protein